MKNSKIKLFIMFLAGIIFSTLAVFAANVTIPTSFNNAVQYLQKLVLTDANNVTGIVLDGEQKKIMSNKICDTSGNNCKVISELITGVDLSDYLTGTSTFLTGEDGKWCIMQNDIIACTEDMPEGGLTEIADYSIKTIHIDTGAITQGQVSGGYVDLTSDQTISGEKTFKSNILFSGATSYKIMVSPLPLTTFTNGGDLNLFAGNSNALMNGFNGGALNLYGGDISSASGGYIQIKGGILSASMEGGYEEHGGGVIINGGVGTDGTGSVTIADNGGIVRIGQSSFYNQHHALNINGYMTIGGNNTFGIYFVDSTNMQGGGTATSHTKIFSTGNLLLMAGDNDSNGKVGIKNSNPQATLDVDGAIRFGHDNSIICNETNVGTLSYSKTNNGSELKICMKTSHLDVYSGIIIASYSGGILGGDLSVGEGNVVVTPGVEP